MDHLLSLKKKLNRSMAYKRFADMCHKQAIKRNPKKEANRCYRYYFNHDIDWENPKDFVEKTFWLLLHTDTSEWTRCADKFLVRDYVKECGLEDLLIPLLGKWDNADEIDFDQLPDQFVIKTNHSCGTNIIVTDKSKLDIPTARQKLNNWLSIPYGYSGMQLHYTKIKPCIIAEELLIEDEEQKKLSPKSLIDYKFFCCDGNPEYIWVAYNRSHSTGVDMTLYDLNWKKHTEHIVTSDYYTYSDVDVPKPKSLDVMIQAAKILSKKFPEVRVDFYEIDGKPYFGELTFTSGWGFFTYDFYDYLGSKIDLSKVKRIK